MSKVAVPTPARLLATVFGCGYSPAAPGTVGSAAALAIAVGIERMANLPPWSFAVLAALATGPAIWAAGAVAHETRRKDPSIVVIDEVIGQWLSLSGAQRLNWKSYLVGFLLFRLFDIWKPPPVRNLEALPGGIGINADDLMAGVYAAAVLWLAGYLGLY